MEYSNFEYSNDNLLSNRVLGDLWVQQLISLGVDDTSITRNYGKDGRGSTDMGNASHKAPTIHPSISITGGVKVSGHSRELAACTVDPTGQEAGRLASKALAFCTIELLADEDLRKRVKEEFLQSE